MLRVAINGFGRIGRICLRRLLQKSNVQIVAINDLADPYTLAHLLRYDSVHGRLPVDIHAELGGIKVDGLSIAVFAETDPSKLPWKDLGIDLVIESTGRFTSRNKAQMHLQAGARQVLISAPSTDSDVPTLVMGVNDAAIDIQDSILSNASCTTNNVAPMVKILDDYWGIVDGYITTVHSMTGDQNLHDAPHKDLRRARAASASIIPTTTGAAKAITTIFPHLKNKLGGAGIRVPVLNGSLTDFTCILKTPAQVDEINAAFKLAAQSSLKGILEYTFDPIVSVDILGNPHSCIFDSALTSVVGGLVKVVGWYDNEFGYASRLADLAERLSK